MLMLCKKTKEYIKENKDVIEINEIQLLEHIKICNICKQNLKNYLNNFGFYGTMIKSKLNIK